jgi:hypothetical protein
MSWTPEVGKILKHQTISQKIVLLERRDIGGMLFWLVEEYDRHGNPSPWMIIEQYLVEQYEPAEAKPSLTN